MRATKFEGGKCSELSAYSVTVMPCGLSVVHPFHRTAVLGYGAVNRRRCQAPSIRLDNSFEMTSQDIADSVVSHGVRLLFIRLGQCNQN